MSDRGGGTPLRPAARAFVEHHVPGARVETLPGDASTRAFYRLTAPDGATRILMDHGGPIPAPSADAEALALFRDAGLPVPALHAVSVEAGCLLLEDLGDTLLEVEMTERLREREAAGPSDRRADAPPARLLEAARLAARIAEAGTPALERSPRAAGPALDADRFRFEMEFFLEHYVGAFRGLPAGAEGLPALREALHDLAERAAHAPRRVLCHRDFHARNLMIAPSGALTMVDVQDARWGPDGYDLASLVHDAYVALPPAWRRAAYDAFVEASALRDAAPAERAAFRRRFRTVSLQRTIKALGTFGHQLAVRGNARFAPAAPRGLARLRELLRAGEPDDAALRAAFEATPLLGGDRP